MTSINRIGTQGTIQKSGEQFSNIDEKADIVSTAQKAVFEQPKGPDFLDKALATSSTAGGVKKELLTEANMNRFIQNNVKVEDQIGIAQNLKPWIKSNFRLHAAQEKAVNNYTSADLQTAEKAAIRATELKTKIQVKFGDDSNSEGQNKLQMEEIKHSVNLKFSGCESEMLQKLQEANARNKQMMR